MLTSVSGGTGAANTTAYTYDAANNVASLVMPGGSCPATPVIPNSTGCVSFAYNNAERRNLVTFPSGAKTATTYDPSSRPTSITTSNSSGAVLVSRAYAHTTATGPAADTALVGTTTDQAGKITTYRYDAANRLVNATAKNSGGSITGQQTFTYDLNGNRTQQVITGSSLGAAGTTNYAYNAADQLCWMGTSSTCTGTTFTNNLLNQVTQESSSLTGITRYVRDPAGTLIGMQDNSGANYYYTLDNVGSVLMLINGSQTAAATYTYAPYGNTLTNTGTGGVNTTNHCRYATGYTDPTGLTKLGARYYNPTIGRFTQTDPSGQEQNVYGCATNNGTVPQTVFLA